MQMIVLDHILDVIDVIIRMYIINKLERSVTADRNNNLTKCNAQQAYRQVANQRDEFLQD